MSEEKEREEHKEHEHHEFHIQIDRIHYIVHKRFLTGEELRHLPTPPIGPDRGLFEVVPGGTDRKIADNEEVEIRDGNLFAHGQPQAIDDALVKTVVENIKVEHEAWIAVFNLRAARP